MPKENKNVQLELEQKMRLNLGKIILKYRKAQDISQLVLSHSLGFMYNVVQHWENATHRIPKAQLERMHLILHIPKTTLGVYFHAPGVLVEEEKYKPTQSRIITGLAERMKMIRAFHEYTIDDMALVLDMKRSQYGRVEMGQANLTHQQISLMRRILNIPYDQIYGDVPVMLPPLARELTETGGTTGIPLAQLSHLE